jgi:flagellar biosynthesis protein FliR
MVGELAQLLEQNLLLAVCVLTRLSTLLMALPAIGVGVPTRIRALLALLLTFLMVPAVAGIDSHSAPQPAHLIDLAIMLAREAAVGLLIGTTVQIVITGVQTAGEIMSGTGGLQLGESVDPSTRSSMPTMAQLVGLLVVATMVVIGGHRYVLSSLMDSFVTLPPGDARLGDPMIELVISQLASSLATGVRVSAPVVAALLLSNLITGLISRTLPQLNVLAIGLSLNAIALLALAALSIGSASYLFREEFSLALDRLTALWSNNL